MPLTQCLGYSDPIDVRDAIPAIELHRNVIYMPIRDGVAWEHDSTWGLYDLDGKLIDAAAYIRGPGPRLVGQSRQQAISSELTIAPPGKYLYVGNIIAHYGHFLISTLSRFWMANEQRLQNYKLVGHGAGNPAGWFSHPYIAEIFDRSGLALDLFTVFKQPTLIPNIAVPRAACQEHNYTHRVFADWGQKIGRNLVCRIPDRSYEIIWLSKTRLRKGVQGLVNEQELIDEFEREGVEIVFPEEMTVSDQVETLSRAKTVMGWTSSAFHTLIFCRKQPRAICLSHFDKINSNYRLIDAVASTRIEYYFGATLQTASTVGKFTAEFVIKDPKAVARDLLKIASNH